MWQEALCCANLLQLPADELAAIAQELADGLEESKEYQAAATIFIDYLGDVESSARCFCKASQYAEAQRIVALRKKPELLERVVDAGLIEGFTATTELLSDCKEQIKAQTSRLRDLRIKKAQEPRKQTQTFSRAAKTDNNTSRFLCRRCRSRCRC